MKKKKRKNDEGKNNMYKQIDQSMMMVCVCERNWQRRGVRKLIRKDKYKCFIAAAQTDTNENENREAEREREIGRPKEHERR